MIDADTIQKGVEVAAYVVAGASAIAALTPTPKDDAILAIVRKVIDCLAFNFGGAKNEKPTDKNVVK